MELKSEKSEITLGLLNAVHGNANVTQRTVSKDLGIALGLTNTYLKRCIKKGLIKVQQAPANRYLYYLTPQGISEKGRLTAEYLSQGFKFFRQTRSDCGEVFQECEKRGWHNIVFHGLTDITEIALLCSANYNLKIVGIVDIDSGMESFSGIPVVRSLTSISPVDAVIITDLDDPEAGVNAMRAHLPANSILVPGILQSTPANSNSDSTS